MTPLLHIVLSKIRWKLLAAMLALLMVQMLTFALIQNGNVDAIMQESLAHRLGLQRKILMERGQTLAQDLRRQAENEIAAFNFSGLAETLGAATRHYPDLAHAILVDAAGLAYVHTRRADLQQTTLTAPEDVFAARQATSTNQVHGQGAQAVMEFIEPIHFGGQHWGALRLGFSLASLNREIEQARSEHERRSRDFVLRELRVSAVILVLSALLVVWLSQALTTPIRRLTESSRKLARGDFSAAQDLEVASQDEVGELAQAFIAMTGNLKASYSRLEKLVEETRRAEAFLDSIVDNLPHMIFVKDARDLRYVRLNKAGEELIGQRQAEFVGRSDYEIYSREIADFFTSKDRDVLQSGRLLDIPEEPIVTRHKGLRYLHTKKIPIVDQDGEPQYLLGISEDITALKQAQDERRLFFTHSLDMLCIADFDGHFLQINPAFETILGYTFEELVARPFVSFVHPDDVEATRTVTAQLAAGADLVAFENRYICKDGSVRWLLWNATPDVLARRIYAVARDMTERRELERQIVQISSLEQERIAHDLHDGLGQVLTGLALKGKMMMQDLASAGQTALADRIREIVALANQASQQARALARGLDPVMLQEGLPAALLDLSQTTRELFGVPCHFEADRFDARLDKFESTHLYRIAQEAVTNAVRHGKPGAICIALTSDGPQINLTVSDDGQGMAANPRKAAGSGLRNMGYRARMIGGTLSVTANDRGGTKVLCTLPRRTPAAPGAPPNRQPASR